MFPVLFKDGMRAESRVSSLGGLQSNKIRGCKGEEGWWWACHKNDKTKVRNLHAGNREMY